MRCSTSSVVPQMFDRGTVKYSAPPSLTSTTNTSSGASTNRPATYTWLRMAPVWSAVQAREKWFSGDLYIPWLSLPVKSAKCAIIAAVRSACSSSVQAGTSGGPPSRSTVNALGSSRPQSSSTSRM